jgi:hypothetical protein
MFMDLQMEIGTPIFFINKLGPGFGKTMLRIFSPSSGSLASNYEEIKEEVVSHFVDLYVEKGGVDLEYFASFLHNIPSLVSLDENLKITKEVLRRRSRK